MAKIELLFHSEVEEPVEERVFVRVFKRFKEAMGERIEEYLGERSGVVNLIIVDDQKIHQINKQYRQKNKPTDVISFAYMESIEWAEEGEVAAGDIFISLGTAKRQAMEHGHSLERELEILFVHGLLHLFGFDHNNDEEEEEMEGWAGRVLG